MNFFKTLAMVGLVILLGIGCYIAGYYQGKVKEAVVENRFNILFDQTYLHLLDQNPETLRGRLENDLSMHWIAERNKESQTIDFNQLFSKRTLKWTEIQLIGFGGILLDYVYKHPTNSLSVEAIDYAKSKSMIDPDSLKIFKAESSTPQ
jgi:hypothetical protein